MGMSDWLEDYHPERLSIEEALDMAGAAYTGMWALSDNPIIPKKLPPMPKHYEKLLEECDKREPQIVGKFRSFVSWQEVFNLVVSISYTDYRKTAQKGYNPLGHNNLVNVVSCSTGGIIISTIRGHREIVRAGFHDVRDYLLLTDGRKVRIIDGDDDIERFFTVHVSADDKIMVISISPFKD